MQLRLHPCCQVAMQLARPEPLPLMRLLPPSLPLLHRMPPQARQPLQQLRASLLPLLRQLAHLLLRRDGRELEPAAPLRCCHPCGRASAARVKRQRTLQPQGLMPRLQGAIKVAAESVALRLLPQENRAILAQLRAAVMMTVASLMRPTLRQA